MPFAGKDQRGEVLIYNGNPKGLHTKPSQVLQGMWDSHTIPSGFGFSLRGDADIDKNDYPGKVHCLFPHEFLLPGKSPSSGKYIMHKHFSHKRRRSSLTWHRFFGMIPEGLSQAFKTKQTVPLESGDNVGKARWL